MERVRATNAETVSEETPSDGMAFQVVQTQLHHLLGMDLRMYKPAQVQRLLDSILRRYRLDGYGALLARLKQDPAMLHDVKSRMSINVSEFFRDPNRFDHLANVVLPDLLAQTSRPAVWSAGASVGCEAYSIAMLLKDRGVLSGARVLGTDIDEDCLARARQGIYWESELRSMPSKMKAQYLLPVRDCGRISPPLPKRQRSDGSLEALFEVDANIRRVVEFRYEDLFASTYRRTFDLIVCRNVTIYFTEDAKKRLYRQLCEALRPGGYLFVGGTEIIFNADQLGLSNPAPFFYQLADSGQR